MERGHVRPRGNSWELRFDVPSSDGRRKTRTVTMKNVTKREAEKELIRLLAAADAGTLPDPSKATIAQYLTGYLENHLDLSGKTRERYDELARLQIIPHLGGTKLTALTGEKVGAWHKKLIDKGLAPRTVKHAHRLLSQMLKRAVDDRKLPHNVASLRNPPRVTRAKIEILEPDQIPILIQGLAGHYVQPIALLALATGMRRGELLALQWSDVDLDGGVVTVERSVEETGTSLKVKPPKTEAGTAQSPSQQAPSLCYALTGRSRCGCGWH